MDLTEKPNTKKVEIFSPKSSSVRPVPKHLRFGTATAAFQVEGAWNVAGKTPSTWDTFCEIPGKIADGTKGYDVCKSYEFYKRDIKMLKFLGVDYYRFSISWPRIMPSGFGDSVCKEGLDHYNKLINALIMNGIEPMITMYHWDLPQTLQDLGGWANPLIAVWFEDYARVLFKAFGDRVKTWITLNEPKQFAVFGYGMSFFAPDICLPGVADYMAVKNLLMAHARAWRLYDKEFREKQKGVCGITIATDFREGASESAADVEAGKLAMDFEVGLCSHPIFSSKGGFPEKVIKRVAERSAQQGFPRSRLPELSPEEIEFIKGTSDFYGLNLYSSGFYSLEKYEPGMYPIPSYDDDVGAVCSLGDYEPGPIFHTTRIPSSMRKGLNWVKDNCNNPPIMITENGYGTFGGLQDKDRVKYFKEYFNAVLDAIDDGCNILSYTTWSLMDNFEWAYGLKAKFGIFEVDFKDEARTCTARSSALWYKHLVATRSFDPDYEPKFEKITFSGDVPTKPKEKYTPSICPSCTIN